MLQAHYELATHIDDNNEVLFWLRNLDLLPRKGTQANHREFEPQATVLCTPQSVWLVILAY